MANENKEMKNMVETLITDLNKNGIRVTDAAVLRLEGDVTDKKVDEAVNKVLKNMEKMSFPNTRSIDQEGQEGREDLPKKECYCSNCFRFDNFEEKLNQFGGQFDYVSVSLLGKVFDLKYHRNPEGKESMMIQAREFSVDPNWSYDTIQSELNVAVQSKDFNKAQLLLTALNNLKNS